MCVMVRIMDLTKVRHTLPFIDFVSALNSLFGVFEQLSNVSLEAHHRLITLYCYLFLIMVSLDDNGIQNWTKKDRIVWEKII